MMKGLLSAARKRLPFFNGTLPGQLTKHGSTASVKWERLNNLDPATTALSEITGTTAAFFGRSTVLPVTATVTAAMAKYGNAVLLTEEIDVYQMNLRAARFMDMLGANAGESLNRLMEVTFATASQIRYSNGSTGGTADTNTNAAISVNDIKHSVNLLNRASALLFTPAGYGNTNIGTTPVRPAYYGICHPDVEEDIRGLTGFNDVVTYGGYTETMPYEFGQVGGVRWCATEIIPISTSAGTTTSTGLRGATNILNDIYSSYIYGKEAFGSVGLGNMHATNSYEMYNPATPPAVEVINKPIGSVGTDLFNEVQSIAWKAWFAAAVLNSNWAVKVRSGATKF
jgi:N4-gp56 family major capsid protein